jgi:hypothetical protein
MAGSFTAYGHCRGVDHRVRDRQNIRARSKKLCQSQWQLALAEEAFGRPIGESRFPGGNRVTAGRAGGDGKIDRPIVREQFAPANGRGRRYRRRRCRDAHGRDRRRDTAGLSGCFLPARPAFRGWPRLQRTASRDSSIVSPWCRSGRTRGTRRDADNATPAVHSAAPVARQPPFGKIALRSKFAPPVS